MENPILEIEEAINLCAGASSPDSQITAFHKYFTRDASFLHPICYVPSRADSRSRVIGIYLFYRIAIPQTSFRVTSVAFDETRGKLFVDLVQSPWLRGLSWACGGWRPQLDMHIHFWLRREAALWLIEKQEDTIQPMAALLSFPPLRPVAYAFYLLCELLGLLNAWVFIMLGFWRPRKHLDQGFRDE